MRQEGWMSLLENNIHLKYDGKINNLVLGFVGSLFLFQMHLKAIKLV